MAIPKDKLCIITPDNFYGVMLRDATFPTFDIKVLKSSEQLQSLAVNFFPDVFLLFSEHLGPTVLANTLLAIRAQFPKVAVFHVEGVREPRVQMLWSPHTNSARLTDSIGVTNVHDVDNAIQALRSSKHEITNGKSLTKAQIDILRLLAEGLSNKEIAEARNTSIRAVETLLNRSLIRIAGDRPNSARAKVVLAQRYLGWKH